jgi:hypothetical protein
MVSVLLTDFLKNDKSGHPVMKRALRRRMRDGQVSLGPDASLFEEISNGENGKVIVLASGNMGLVSFTGAATRLTMEQIDAAYDELMPSLIEHPGIAFALVETDDRGPIAIGRSGFYSLRDDQVHGENPLEGYSPNLPCLLRRASGFRNTPDLLVIGRYWEAANEIAAFENLVSSHGGIGGNQTVPFVLSPVELDLGDSPIVGASALHRVFKRWVSNGQSDPPR